MSTTSPRDEIIFKALYWNYEDDVEENELKIFIGGLTPSNESVQIIVTGFLPWVYVELPDRVKTPAKLKSLFEFFQKRFKCVSYALLKLRKLHYNIHVDVMQLMFKTHTAAKSFSYEFNNLKKSDGTLKKMIFVDNIAFKPGEFVVHEANISPDIKFTAKKNIDLAGWLKVKETILPEFEGTTVEERKFSSADVDCYAKWQDVEPFTPDTFIVTNPSYLSFDIECYSHNHNSKIPDPTQPRNKIFSVGAVCGRFGTTTTNVKKYLVTLGNPHDIPDTTVVRCRDEKELLLKFRDVIVEENPDVFIGYNIMKFDWNYLVLRARLLGIETEFLKFSRLNGKIAHVGEIKWGSNAYGKQEMKYVDAHGRLNLDAMIEIVRNYKFPKYSLDYVSTEFLKETKDDVTPRQLFMLVQLYDEMYEDLVKLAERGDAYKGILKKYIRRKICRILLARFCTGEALQMRKRMLNARSLEQLIYEVRDTLTITGKYNIQDCILPIKLCEKLNIQISMEETSNVTKVPVTYLHTRGQGIKVLAQIFRKTISTGYLIQYQRRIEDHEKKRYIGAIVAEANPGYYENVACFDFASLYPTIMIAMNICYTTLVRDDDPIPDEECHVLEWDDHHGCEHDRSGKQVDKKKVLCQHHRYRFRKLKILADGTRLNEGIMPRMERELLAARKKDKKEMEKVEAQIEMSLGQSTPDKIEEYRSMGWEIIPKGYFTENELANKKTEASVLNAKQLAKKVAANSGYGYLGAQQGEAPLVEGAASVTYMGRTLITRTNRFLKERYPGDPQRGGKGAVKLVYGDTDSTMVFFFDFNVEETFTIAEKIAPEITHFLKCMILGVDEHLIVCSTKTFESWELNTFPRKRVGELNDDDKIMVYQYDALPISLTFENLYGKYFLLTKKRYCARVVNRRGEVTKDTKKGVVLARRDNAKFLREAYKELIDAVMAKRDKDFVFNAINNRVNMLFTRQVPDTSFVIYVGVKDIIAYAKKREIKRPGGNALVYIDSDGQPVETSNPLDPRLVYPNLPQVLLALKMMRRGDDVPANTRLEFLYTYQGPEFDGHQGEKSEDYMFYKENKLALNLKPDFFHYIEKQLTKPVMELVNVKFKGDIIPYLSFADWYDRSVAKLDEVNRVRISNIGNEFIRCVPEYTPTCETITTSPTHEETITEDGDVVMREVENVMHNQIYVGWEVMCKACRNAGGGATRCTEHSPRHPPRIYTFKNLAKSKEALPRARIEFILEKCRESRQGVKNTIPHGSDIEKMCLTYKSLWTINASRVYNHNKKKLGLKKPKQCSERLPVGNKKEGPTQVIFLDSFPEYNISPGTLGKIQSVNTIKRVTLTSKGTNKETNDYFYDVRVTDPVSGDVRVASNIPRYSLTTFTRRDDRLLVGILAYRQAYNNVIFEIQCLSMGLNFIKNQ